MIEGNGWLKKALAEGGGVSSNVRANVLHGAGVYAIHAGDTDRAKSFIRESLELCEDTRNRRLMAHILNTLGLWLRSQGDLRQSIAYFERSLVLCRETGAEAMGASSMAELAVVNLQSGDLDRAQDLLDESLAIFKSIGDDFGIANVLIFMADIQHYRGDDTRAIELLEEAIALFESFDKGLSFKGHNIRAGRLALELKQNGRAKSISSEYLIIARRAGRKNDIVRCMNVLARVAVSEGQDTRAARLIGKEKALRDALSLALPLEERKSENVAIAALRDRMSDESFARHIEEGREMTTEDAIAYALEEKSYAAL